VRLPIHRLNRWWRLPGYLDLRPCPKCCAIVYGDPGQRGHQAWHDAAEPDDDEWEDPGGYVIGNGPLPASVRGGSDE